MADNGSSIDPETIRNVSEEEVLKEDEDEGAQVSQALPERHDVAESSEIRIAEREAKEAILNAVKKMRELNVATTVDLSKELHELRQLIYESPSYSASDSGRSSFDSEESSHVGV
jgi:hypothetical protein